MSIDYDKQPGPAPRRCIDRTVKANPRGKSSVTAGVVFIEDAGGKPIAQADAVVGRKIELRANLARVQGEIKETRWNISAPHVGHFELEPAAIVTPTVVDQQSLSFYIIEGNRVCEVCLHVKSVGNGVTMEYEAAAIFTVAGPKLTSFTVKMDALALQGGRLVQGADFDFEVELPSPGEVALVTLGWDVFERATINPLFRNQKDPKRAGHYKDQGLPRELYIAESKVLLAVDTPFKSGQPVGRVSIFELRTDIFVTVYWEYSVLYHLMWRETSADIWTTIATADCSWKGTGRNNINPQTWRIDDDDEQRPLPGRREGMLPQASTSQGTITEYVKRK